jgi:hypothetical protein
VPGTRVLPIRNLDAYWSFSSGLQRVETVHVLMMSHWLKGPALKLLFVGGLYRGLAIMDAYEEGLSACRRIPAAPGLAIDDTGKNSLVWGDLVRFTRGQRRRASRRGPTRSQQIRPRATARNPIPLCKHNRLTVPFLHICHECFVKTGPVRTPARPGTATLRIRAGDASRSVAYSRPQ